MTTHTPGPWKVAGQGNGKQELLILGPSGEIGCVRSMGWLADARLIAAAPDLLKACKATVRLLRRVTAEIECETQCNALQDAIAKATATG